MIRSSCFWTSPRRGWTPQSRRNFWSLIEEVRRRGKTLVLTTHYMEEAQRLCDEIVIADQGRIIAGGTPGALVKEQFPASVVRLPLTAWPQGSPMPEGCQVRNGYLEIYGKEVSPLLERLERAGADLDELRVDTPNLEDLFLELTGHDLRG